MRNALYISLMILVGCGPLTVPVNPDKKKDDTKPVVVNPAPEDMFEALADGIDTFATTTDLARGVKLLFDNGKLSVDDVKKIDDALKGYASVERPLTKEDAKTLRGIK